MGDTIVYLIRHSKQLKIKGKKTQIENEKIVLSIKGEKIAEEISKLEEMQNIDKIWSSNYCRAISTAKYIAYENNIDINIDENLNERKLRRFKRVRGVRKIQEKSIYYRATKR